MVRKQSHWGGGSPPLVLLLIICLIFVETASSQASESDILLKFKASLANTTALDSWKPSTNPCTTWVGLRCFDNTIRSLQLGSMGLSGTIDVDALAGLKSLRSISFMNNSFRSPIPPIWKLGALKSVYLSHNHFYGEIPDDAFTNMGSLKFLYLETNELTGKIPSSLGRLPRLMELRLDDNKFQGNIPDFRQTNLRWVTMANNQLVGPIPANLLKMDTEAFAGNKGLCGGPMTGCSAPKNYLVIIISVIAIVVTLVILALIVIIIRRRNQTAQLGRPSSINSSRGKVAACEEDQMETRSQQDQSVASSKKSENGKLSFVRDDRERFELQDLLRASAEVLGSGSFGSSYKAVLANGKAMVVKRFRHMNKVGREDFQEHMRRLGRLRHRNLLPLVAYYYRKEEKLLVSDFVENGSLASLLHSNRTEGETGLDWPTRLKIMKGVASGLAYLHKELPSLSVPHAHLKSSNVIINESWEPLLTDYGLVPVINNENAAQIMVAYKSPEYAEDERVTKKSDVWCLGTLILEVLTGKLPMNHLKQCRDGDPDLANWVNSVPKEEWTEEIFDKEMGGTKNGEGEMMKLLKIGLSCCEADLEKRLELNEAVEKIEEVSETDNDDDFYSSHASQDMREDFSLSL